MSPAARRATGLRWLGLLLVLICMVVLVAAAECFARYRQWTLTGVATHQEDLYRVDETTRLRILKPNRVFGRITTNALGFRGPEIAQPKPAGRIRIAFLGASTTFCAEVSGDAASWPHRVVERLNGQFAPVRFDYVNAAVPGYSVMSSLRNFERRVKPLSPDIVVIYHATNNLSAELRELARDDGLLDAEAGRSWLEQHFLLWDLAVKNLRLLRAERGIASRQGRLQIGERTLAADFRQGLSNLLHSASAASRRVAVATFSTRLRASQSPDEQKEAAVSALAYTPFMSPGGLIQGYASYNRAIREEALRHGALLIGGETDIPGDAAHFADTVHFTDAGSAAMAQRVATALAADAVVQAMVAAAAPPTAADPVGP